ncbi:DUF881 domain-containing protein [Streptomyces sp. RFCAC02]|uniref:DUF881 domain-containing protein n=1 Tax=Streptomyces sp. RFCAC02 TaxID=2499143 RepID=UPI0010205280|nr:DUF881 domain-containing protein [Streptomyces sp. RFCAC02]
MTGTPPREHPDGAADGIRGTDADTPPSQDTATGAAGDGDDGGPAASRPAGARLLLAALWPPRATGSQFVAAGLLFVLGLGLAIQVRAANSEDTALAGARTEDLVRILSDLDDRAARLEAERADLERQRTELENSSDQAEEARRQNEERAGRLGVLAGTEAARGPGITLRIADPLGTVEADMLLDAVQELRAAGAEAIQINEVRIVAETAFTDDNGGIRLDGRPVSAPYLVRAIGRPQDLEPALNIPGGVVQSLENDQASVSVERSETITVDALRSPEQPDYAQSSP